MSSARYVSTYPVRLAPSAAAPTSPTASRVRSTPVTSQGWRPISVTIQPASVAIHPENVNAESTHNSQRGAAYPRRVRHVAYHDTSSISTPIPTITRNAKNTGVTGGTSGAKA